MKIIFKTIPLGQDKQFCLDLPLQEDEIKLRVHSVEIDEGAGEGKGNNKNYWSCLREAWRKGQTWLMLHEWFAEKDFFDKLCLYRGKLSKATMQVFWCVHESELFNEEMEHLSPRPCRGLPRGWSAPLQEKFNHWLRAERTCSWGHSKPFQVMLGCLIWGFHGECVCNATIRET